MSNSGTIVIDSLTSLSSSYNHCEGDFDYHYKKPKCKGHKKEHGKKHKEKGEDGKEYEYEYEYDD